MTASDITSAPPAAPWTAEDRKKTRRAALAGGVGTLIEYYDFSLYGYLAVVIAPLYFPSEHPVTSLLSALAVFGTAYLVRPLGGIVFGHIGDRLGRKKALMATLVCMGVGSTAMGLLPTPAQIGVWATVMLVIVRLLQGFSAGGEVGGSATFISESAPSHLKATYGAFTPMGSTGGFALAAAVAGIVSALTTDVQMDSWGWRVPFLLALPLTLFCLWVRTRVEETHEVTETKAEKSSPVNSVFLRQPRALAQATALSAAVNGTAYIGLTYMAIHLTKQLGYESTSVFWVATMAIGIAALAMPLAGRLGDRIGTVRLMAIGFIGFIVLTYPMMGLMHMGLVVATIAFVVIMLNSAAAQVGAYTILPQFFDKPSRYTGVAMGWNLGVIIAGGTAPFVAVWLVEKTGNILSPAFFVMTLAAVGLTALATIRARHTQGA
ncbi:MFS transporter [Rhodococcoides kyotonense]|uniref:Putative proline/betaine transporter n=1 Tax=Rhodococcoides kyotonense TaxID=398843 RepID=A0A239DVU5_9NOCA|nr:MFS transporter [Rhodococcus kyotonensis]SNS36088.1 MFS transporter, MHS family, proline/betaine transporter [Rhodococcus kyotonensis]